jgi:hypothetical protein
VGGVSYGGNTLPIYVARETEASAHELNSRGVVKYLTIPKSDLDETKFLEITGYDTEADNSSQSAGFQIWCSNGIDSTNDGWQVFGSNPDVLQDSEKWVLQNPSSSQAMCKQGYGPNGTVRVRWITEKSNTLPTVTTQTSIIEAKCVPINLFARHTDKVASATNEEWTDVVPSTSNFELKTNPDVRRIWGRGPTQQLQFATFRIKLSDLDLAQGQADPDEEERLRNYMFWPLYKTSTTDGERVVEEGCRELVAEKFPPCPEEGVRNKYKFTGKITYDDSNQRMLVDNLAPEADVSKSFGGGISIASFESELVDLEGAGFTHALFNQTTNLTIELKAQTTFFVAMHPLACKADQLNPISICNSSVRYKETTLLLSNSITLTVYRKHVLSIETFKMSVPEGPVLIIAKEYMYTPHASFTDVKVPVVQNTFAVFDYDSVGLVAFNEGGNMGRVTVSEYAATPQGCTTTSSVPIDRQSLFYSNILFRLSHSRSTIPALSFEFDHEQIELYINDTAGKWSGTDRRLCSISPSTPITHSPGVSLDVPARQKRRVGSPIRRVHFGSLHLELGAWRCVCRQLCFISLS